MISPTMTVLVLVVLWLIVLVPMVIKAKDDRAGERSVARFGGAMRALSSRGRVDHTVAAEHRAGRRSSSAQVFIPGGPPRLPQVPPAGRRPVPAAMEAVMYPDQIAKADMSDARRQMMARRRRSLAILIAGTVIGLLWGVAAGGALAWTVALLFVASLAGYLLFLRNQALHDRDRRQQRQQRSGLAQAEGVRRHRAVSLSCRARDRRRPDRRRGRGAAGDRRHHRPDRAVRRGGVRRAVHAPGGVTAQSESAPGGVTAP